MYGAHATVTLNNRVTLPVFCPLSEPWVWKLESKLSTVTSSSVTLGNRAGRPWKHPIFECRDPLFRDTVANDERCLAMCIMRDWVVHDRLGGHRVLRIEGNTLHDARTYTSSAALLSIVAWLKDEQGREYEIPFGSVLCWRRHAGGPCHVQLLYNGVTRIDGVSPKMDRSGRSILLDGHTVSHFEGQSGSIHTVYHFLLTAWRTVLVYVVQTEPVYKGLELFEFPSGTWYDKYQGGQVQQSVLLLLATGIIII